MTGVIQIGMETYIPDSIMKPPLDQKPSFSKKLDKSRLSKIEAHRILKFGNPKIP